MLKKCNLPLQRYSLRADSPLNSDFEVIVDNMMNLELLFWASTQGNRTFQDIAISHADVTLRDIFQPFNPGCVWHLLQYDYTTGALKNRSSTPQGLGLNTVWSRGQAWATNGYAIAYRFTQLPRFLAAAQAAADCFLRLLPVCSTDSIPVSVSKRLALHSPEGALCRFLNCDVMCPVPWIPFAVLGFQRNIESVCRRHIRCGNLCFWRY